MYGYGFFPHAIITGLLIFTIHGNIVLAQDTIRTGSGDTIYQKVLELEQTLKEITTTLEAQHQEEELEALMKEADRLSTQQEEVKVDLSKKFFSGVRQQQGLNPNISFGMDFFGGFSTSDAPVVSEPCDLGYGNNGFFLREAQLSLVAPLDPYTRGKAFISAGEATAAGAGVRLPSVTRKASIAASTTCGLAGWSLVRKMTCIRSVIVIRSRSSKAGEGSHWPVVASTASSRTVSCPLVIWTVRASSGEPEPVCSQLKNHRW